MKPDYDDPKVEEAWIMEQRAAVENYLRSQRVKYGQIGEWPAWHVVPYVSVWAIESRSERGAIGWWAIAGDLPTDYISGKDVTPVHPREAMRAFARQWLRLVESSKQGQELEDYRIAGDSSPQELAPLLQSRAQLLLQWADDDSLWNVD
jgi:hypothetical protein